MPSGALALTNADLGGSVLESFVLPIDSIRGAYVFVEANVKAEDVSTKSQPWNGIKLMVKIETPGRTDWPQPNLPVGTFDWQRFSNRVFIPADANAATLVLGLEKVSGTVWFDQVEIALSRFVQSAPAAPQEQPIFRGHNFSRLRGAMVSPNMTEADLSTLADDWSYHAFREWAGWSLEHSADEQNEKFVAEKTARFNVIERVLKLNYPSNRRTDKGTIEPDPR